MHDSLMHEAKTVTVRLCCHAGRWYRTNAIYNGSLLGVPLGTSMHTGQSAVYVFELALYIEACVRFLSCETKEGICCLQPILWS